MTRTKANIGQRTSYPRAMRVAVVKSHAKATTASVATDYNISKSTVNKWAKAAKKAKAQPTQLAAYQLAAAALKAYDTPTLLGPQDKAGNVVPASATHIQFRGKTYTV